jgi:ATP-binding cassette subfamily B protein
MSGKEREYIVGENEVQKDDVMDMSGMANFEKPKNFRKTLKNIAGYLRAYLPATAAALLLAGAGAALLLAGPNRLSEITDLIEAGFVTGIDLRAAAAIGFTLVAVYAGSLVLSVAQGLIMTTVTQNMTKRMRTDISEKINRLPIRYYNKHTTGDVLSRVTNDADAVGQNLNQCLSQLVASAALLLGALIMMFLTNWILALTAVGATVAGFALLALIMGKSQKYFESQQNSLGKINGHVEETYAGHTVVKAYNGERETRERFMEINGGLRDSAFKAQFLSGLMMPVMIFIENLGYVAVCVVGAALVMSGVVKFGVIVAFVLYVRYFSSPLTQIAQALQMLQMASAAAERVFGLLDEEEMSDESGKTKRLVSAAGRVDFQNVRFGYEDGDKIVIHDFTATALPGQKVAIVGPTGAGKTTLVNLLMRFNELSGGSILIDGIPASDLTRENVREQFCMILQDTWLFGGTIKENVIYCKTGVCDEDVIKACKAVGLDHFIRTLPNGYDTVLDDKANLSAGQKQQITIARAMIENAPMLILDEATSSVDTRTELHIQEAMDRLTEGRTSFVIAHRLSTIKNADLILVLRDGDIAESGTHGELLEKKGFYFELYNSQFEAA